MEKIKILFRIKAGTGQPFYINHIKSALNGQTFHKEINGPLGMYFHLVDWMSKLCWKLKGYEEFIVTRSLCKIISSWWQRHVERTSKTWFFKNQINIKWYALLKMIYDETQTICTKLSWNIIFIQDWLLCTPKSHFLFGYDVPISSLTFMTSQNIWPSHHNYGHFFVSSNFLQWCAKSIVHRKQTPFESHIWPHFFHNSISWKMLCSLTYLFQMIYQIIRFLFLSVVCLWCKNILRMFCTIQFQACFPWNWWDSIVQVWSDSNNHHHLLGTVAWFACNTLHYIHKKTFLYIIYPILYTQRQSCSEIKNHWIIINRQSLLQMCCFKKFRALVYMNWLKYTCP